MRGSSFFDMINYSYALKPSVPVYIFGGELAMPLVTIYSRRSWFPQNGCGYDELSESEKRAVFAGKTLAKSILPAVFRQVDRKFYDPSHFFVNHLLISDWAEGANDWQIVIHPPTKRFWFFAKRRSERRLQDIAERVRKLLQAWFVKFESEELYNTTDRWQGPSYGVEVTPLTMCGLSVDQSGNVTARW